MHTNIFAAAVGIAFVGFSSAHPQLIKNGLTKRVVSPDNSCGIQVDGTNSGYSCVAGVNEGGCCSQYGFCGAGAEYCDTSPQCSYGTCTTTPEEPSGDNTRCGPSNGGASCSNKQCCSQAGYCGTTADFCADPGSCLPGFGRCDSDTTPAGASTANAPRPNKGPVTYTDDIYDCVQNNVVALTYDDGPFQYTAQLLDILKSYGFTATFFITGNNNGKGAIDTTAPYPDLIRRMVAEGHQVASHTWSHYSLTDSTSAVRKDQMVKNEMALNNIIGKWPTYMRPPYSQCSQSSGCWTDMQALGYHRVYFDLDTQDYLNPLPSQIQNSKVIVKAKLADLTATDYLSIQHDIVGQSVTNLTSYYFDQIKARGWKGVTAAECLGDTNKDNWYRSLGSSPPSTSASLSASSTQASSAISSSVITTSSSAVTSSSSITPSSSTTSPRPTTTSSILPTPATTTTRPAPTTTTTQPPTTPTQTPAKCILKNGNWCGQLEPFSDSRTCNAAKTDCYRETTQCIKANFFGTATCLKWNSICLKLGLYCLRCFGGGCSNGGFNY